MKKLLIILAIIALLLNIYMQLRNLSVTLPTLGNVAQQQPVLLSESGMVSLKDELQFAPIRDMVPPGSDAGAQRIEYIVCKKADPTQGNCGVWYEAVMAYDPQAMVPASCFVPGSCVIRVYSHPAWKAGLCLVAIGNNVATMPPLSVVQECRQ